jgi:phosphomannomutase
MERVRSHRDADDLRPRADVVIIRHGADRVVFRPSGTEPKLKLYVDLRIPLAPAAPLGPAEERGRKSALDVAQALVTALGLDAA